MLDRSLEHYHAERRRRGKAVSWYSTSRIMTALAAYRLGLRGDARGVARALGPVGCSTTCADVQPGGGCAADHRTGEPQRHTPRASTARRACMWYAGLAMLDEGMDDDAGAGVPRGRVTSGTWQLLEHRRNAAGRRRRLGLARRLGTRWAPTRGRSSTSFTPGRRRPARTSPTEWPHVALFANYVMWNYLPGGHEFGYGDARHTTNRSRPASNMPHAHRADDALLLRDVRPEWVALMRHLREEMFPGGYSISLLGRASLPADADGAGAGADGSGRPSARAALRGHGAGLHALGVGAGGHLRDASPPAAILQPAPALRQWQLLHLPSAGSSTVDSGTRE
jgi:hypothetical protein